MWRKYSNKRTEKEKVETPSFFMERRRNRKVTEELHEKGVVITKKMRYDKYYNGAAGI